MLRVLQVAVLVPSLLLFVAARYSRFDHTTILALGLAYEVIQCLSSGYSEQESTVLFVEEGLAGFLQKPLSLARLREKFREVLG